MKTVVEHICTGAITQISSYDSSKTNVGSLIKQKTGNNPLDKYIGPMPIGVARPMEASVAIPVAYPSVVPWSTDKHWVFFADNSTAAATRRIVMYEYDLNTSQFNWNGYIFTSGVVPGNKTIRGFRMVYETYSTGTVAVNGTGVFGSGTMFTDDRMAVGARIGFGSTIPTGINTWYTINSIVNNTSLGLSSSAGAYPSGTPYIIEELRAVMGVTNSVASGGGVLVLKGLNPSSFSAAGYGIPDATTLDNRQAGYMLVDNMAVPTNTTIAGMGLDSIISTTGHFTWVLNGTTTAQIYKYNLRAPLTTLGGRSASAFEFSTGISAALAGTASQANNGRIITCNHGPGSGVKSFYFTTTTRVYRCAENTISSGSTTFLTDVMVEVPPGGSTTYALTSVFQSVDYSDSIDKLIILTSAAAGVRSYITKYNTTADAFDHIFLMDSKQTDQSTADSDGVIHPTLNATAMSVWSENGIFYLCRNGTTAILNQIYAVPVGAHWTYAVDTNQRLISPVLSTTNATKLYRVYVNCARQLGSGTLGSPPEPIRIYVRTSGISDNSGAWILLDDSNDLSSITVTNEIQIMIEFKTIGGLCIPNRIYNFGVVYEDSNTDSHYNPSVTKSSAASRIFAWRQGSLWGGTIPDLNILIYNLNTNGVILDDTVTSSSAGNWEYSTDGSNWNVWSSSADLVGNYIRYTADSLPDGIPVKAVIIQA